ncbi:MAG: sigma-54-dependent Fis family transcriptional regulator [Magnetococcales bacterium]|nr:sigma-54-dependent Fis family transcriptional regulator [Magnetococcales bacterium]
MARALNVLIVDDEPAIRQVLAAALAKSDFQVESACDGQEALQRLEVGDIDIAICDIKMPGMDGIEVVRKAKQLKVDTVFLMMTAFASVDTAVDAMKAGAYDYLTKPLRRENVLHRLAQIRDWITLQEQNRTLRHLVDEGGPELCRLLSPPMLEVERLLRKVAPTDFTVLVTGDSGTGKGMIAHKIHQLSQRSAGLFIPVNCGSIPENLLESEFFGHVKGAFTGADRAKKGLFVEADNGTLFLDEIGELPLHLQVKLLHALEEKRVRPVGSEQFRRADVRIIAATNQELGNMVKAGTFREDLFFRLNVFNIHLPPLRERRQDILPLLRHVLDKQKRAKGWQKSFRIDPDAETALLNYDWPGNVRELEHSMERASILAEDGVITLTDLPQNLQYVSTPPAGDGAVAPTAATNGGKLRDLVRDYEMQVILESIERADGDRRLAARALGIGLSSLYRKLEQPYPPDLFSE